MFHSTTFRLLKGLSFILVGAAFAPAPRAQAAPCNIQCVSCCNSDGTGTVCRNFGGGVWRCQNVPAKQLPAEE